MGHHDCCEIAAFFQQIWHICSADTLEGTCPLPAFATPTPLHVGACMTFFQAWTQEGNIWHYLTLTVNRTPDAEHQGSPLSGSSKVKGDAEIGMRVKPTSLGKEEKRQ